jgi:hypothetical protein
MHPAHPVIGVARSLAIFRPNRWQEEFSIVGRVSPITVTLVSAEISGRVAATLGWFRRMLPGRLNADCRCAFIDLAEGLSELNGLEPTDCTVLIHQGITMLRRPSECMPGLLVDSHLGPAADPVDEMAIQPTLRPHPLLEGVGPFVTHSDMFVSSPPTDSVCLLLGERNGQTHSVAWADDAEGNRQFHTSLGFGDDIRRPSFCRLLLNAVAWIAQDPFPGT